MSWMTEVAASAGKKGGVGVPGGDLSTCVYLCRHPADDPTSRLQLLSVERCPCCSVYRRLCLCTSTDYLLRVPKVFFRSCGKHLCFSLFCVSSYS